MLRLQDIMTTTVETVSPDLSLYDAMELLSTRHLSGVPVVAHGKVLGVLSSTDVLRTLSSFFGEAKERQDDIVEKNDGEEEPLPDEELNDPANIRLAELWANLDTDVSEQFRDGPGGERNVLEESTVEEAMTRAICSLPPDTPIDQAAQFMCSADIHRVLVMKDEHLVGIVTTTDITSAVAKHMV